MGQEQDKPRGFVNRYWIVIVIVLWLIAWSARDVLAPGVEATPDGSGPGPAVVVEPSEPEPRASNAEAAPERDAVPPRSGAAAEAPSDMDADVAAARSKPESAGAAHAAQALLDEARGLYWNEGPEAAAQRLRDGLETLPADSVQRADVNGELGNVLYHAGQVGEAMAAWDRALKHLPARERRAMLQRLAPIYGRYHADGLRHLQQFE